jgi:hypothetical protein
MPFDFPNQGPIGDLDILVDARARVSGENQWIKGRFEDGDRHCLVAALSLACGSRSFNIPNKTERRLVRLLANQLSPDLPWRMRSRLVPARSRLMSFNDCSRTRQADVGALFGRTISCLVSNGHELALAA